MSKRITKITGIAAATSLAVFGLTACDDEEVSAENFPDRNIQIYVGFGPGGGSDLFARQVQQGMENIHDANVQVVNMEGAGGATAIREVHGRDADGHTWYADYSFAVLAGQGDLGENGDDMLSPVVRFQDEISHLMVMPDRFPTWEDFEEEAQTETLRLGGVGSAGFAEYISRQFVAETGFDITYVPFENAGEQLAALQSGNIDAAMEELAAALDYIDSGEIISIMAMNDDRLDEYPDIPASVELGIDVTTGASRGIMVHGETDEEIIDIIEEMLEEVYESEEYKEFEAFSLLDHRPGWMDRAEYTEFTDEIIDYTRDLQEGD